MLTLLELGPRALRAVEETKERLEAEGGMLHALNGSMHLSGAGTSRAVLNNQPHPQHRRRERLISPVDLATTGL